MAKTRVYYNGACPVCDAGITQQRKWLEPFEADIDVQSFCSEALSLEPPEAPLVG